MRVQPRSGRGRISEQNRLRAIVDHMADGVVIVGMDGRIRFANPAAQELFGRPITELTGADLGFPAVEGDSTEIEILHGGGSSVTAELRVVDVEWNGERVRLVSLRDVTDRRRALDRAAQLQRERIARAEAEASSHAKSEFLAMMSHELRTPLNAVLGYAELLDLGIAGPIAEEQRRHVARIRDSARHLLGLVNEILDLSKVEAGRLTVHNRAWPIGEAVDAALALVQPAAEARGIRITWECPRPEATYLGDEDRVRQILINLLNNAVKFTPPGGSIAVDCETSTRPDSRTRMELHCPCLCVRVTDTGVGIPAEQLAAIFDPFVQVERGHTRSKDGSGLGLTISRRLARLMSGDITVRSEPDRGSTFALWLPEASAVQREAARWRAASPNAAERLVGLGELGTGLLRELPTFVDSFVARLRDELDVRSMHVLRPAQLADHVGTYVADLAGTLGAIEESMGQPSRLVADGAEIQTNVAERHGAQRARLGWTESHLRREWAILREELSRAMRRAGADVGQPAVAEASMIVERFVEQGEEISVRALHRTAENGDRERRGGR